MYFGELLVETPPMRLWRLLVLELPRQTRSQPDPAVGRGHVRNRCTGDGRGEDVGLGDGVGRLVAAPRVAVQPDGVGVGDAHVDQLLHAGHQRLDRGDPRAGRSRSECRAGRPRSRSRRRAGSSGGG